MKRLRIIVAGLVGQYPVGGVAWDYLQYVVGLARLGHDVYYHEDTWSWPFHPVENRLTSGGTYSARFIGEFFERFAPELATRWHYRQLHEESFGMSFQHFVKVARSADLFLNVSGACIIPEELSGQCVKVFLDTDPGYNQIVLSERPSWSENVERWVRSFESHDRYFTYAENINGADCGVPRLGVVWRTTRMPIVLDLWKSSRETPPLPTSAWSTVMTWNAFKGPLVYRGVELQSKGAEFEKVFGLPQRTQIPVRLAVGGVGAPLARLRENGWLVTEAPASTLTAERYLHFITSSRGEFSVAKQVYVALRTGWFSCRSACYLAAARPVVVQDTGFSSDYPTGEGLLCFSDMEEAVCAMEAVERDYGRHAARAVELADTLFGSERVLSKLIDESCSADS